MVYFLADLTWVARVPTSVKSPAVIIKVRRLPIACLSDCSPLLGMLT